KHKPATGKRPLHGSLTPERLSSGSRTCGAASDQIAFACPVLMVGFIVVSHSPGSSLSPSRKTGRSLLILSISRPEVLLLFLIIPTCTYFSLTSTVLSLPAGVPVRQPWKGPCHLLFACRTIRQTFPSAAERTEQ